MSLLKQIGIYQYDEKHCLGEGAYGKVFSGVNQKTGEAVAIKKLDLVLFERDQYLRNQIVQEIEILKKFNHPNIVKFSDLQTTQRSLYIITELCKDGDLKELLIKKRLSEKEASQIMMQIVSGFKELVKLGIIHRDLKPANILNSDGVVKIADFGFAKYVDNYSSQLLRSCVGSPLYMAPQVLSRKPYSTKCDIWSLGVIFYEMVFHEVPWKGRDEQDLLRNILTKPLVMKPKFQYTKHTEEFLKRSLSVDENQRLSWDDVFSMFDAQIKEINITNLMISFHDPADEGEKVQKVPNWIQNNGSKPTAELIEKQMKLIINNRSEIAFKHFVCVEMTMKQDMIRATLKKPQQLDELIGLLSKIVLSSSMLMINQLTEICDESEHVLGKAAKWNILNQLKSEQNFYQIHYDDFKEQLQRQIPQFMQQEDFKKFYDEELNDIAINKLNEIIIKKAQQFVMELTEEIQKKVSNRSNDKEAFLEIGIVADYIVDLIVIRKKLAKSHEIDYNEIHLEKSIEGDSRRVLDRTQRKLKQSVSL